jgi:hypothetical protein
MALGETSMRYQYHERSDLAIYYFEDSYVLGIKLGDGQLIFIMDLVLTPRHPAYTSPDSTEQHCYRRGSLIILKPGKLDLRIKFAVPFTDSTGEIDYGNIDTFELDAANHYWLAGGWGTLECDADAIRVDLDSNQPSRS